MSVISIYAQEDLSQISSNDMVFFLAGPTNPTYFWRETLVDLVKKYITENNIKLKNNVYFLIPESRIHKGRSSGTGNNIKSLKNKNKPFYEKCKFLGFSFDFINQIQWETDGIDMSHVVYNMCQHWNTDIANGTHGNISPTGRLEVCPQYSDKSKWIYYNNLEGNYDLNRTNCVMLGGEHDGENIGWLVWWIVKRDLTYVTNVKKLVDEIAKRIKFEHLN